MQIPTFMHGSENNNSHFEGLQLGPDNKEFSCLFQIYIKNDEMLIATSNMLRVLFFVVLHVAGMHISIDKSKEWQIEERNCKGNR
jgi:hypothetical protein